jgi:hypothetical protein
VITIGSATPISVSAIPPGPGRETLKPGSSSSLNASQPLHNIRPVTPSATIANTQTSSTPMIVTFSSFLATAPQPASR